MRACVYGCVRTCVRACVGYVLVRVCVCVRVRVRACAYEGLKTPFLLMSFFPREGLRAVCPLEGGLGGLSGLSPFALKITMQALRGSFDLVI